MTLPPAAFAVNLLWCLGWALLLQEGAARSGAGLLPLLRRRAIGPLGLAGAGALLGWCVYGSSLLGMAAVGLFRPGPIVATALACVLGSRAGRSARVLWWDAARAAGGTEGRWLAAFGAGMAPVLVATLTPGMDQDSFVYHLGTPWEWLQTGRCFAGTIQLGSHVPLLTDLTNILPILLDDQRLAKGLVVGALGCGAAFWAGRCRERSQPLAAWTGPLLAISAASMPMLLNTGKNDVPACMLFLVGACLTLDGAWIAGAAMLGLAFAAKFVYGPQILLWLLFVRPPRRLWPAASGLLLLPSLPWWAKTWIATGNPLFPFGAGLFGRFDWTPANQEVFDYYQRGLWEAGLWRWQEVLAGGWWRSMWSAQPLLLAALPPLLWFRGSRWPALACMAGGLATLSTGHQMRYTLPTTILLSCLAARELDLRAGRWRPAVAALLAGYALVRVGLNPQWREVGWEDTWSAPASARAARLGTFEEAGSALASLHATRVVLSGEARQYRLPGRVLFGGYFGETPLAWKIAHASAGVDDVRRRFRQLGARYLLHNYVSVESTEVPYRSFVWTDRALRVYVDFCKRHLVPVWHSATADYVNGGFYVLEVRHRPPGRPPATTWFAPGTESVYGAATELRLKGRWAEALAAYLDAAKRLPDVGATASRVGHAYAALGDMPRTLAALSLFAEQGMMDSMNLPEYAAALVNTGRTANTERVLDDAWHKYPNHRTMIRLNQAGFLCQQALAALNAGRPDPAVRALDRAEALLGELRPGAEPGHERGRVLSVAYLTGLRGELWLARGDRAQAAKWFRDSLALDASTPLSGRWRQLADQTRMF